MDNLTLGIVAVVLVLALPEICDFVKAIAE